MGIAHGCVRAAPANKTSSVERQKCPAFMTILVSSAMYSLQQKRHTQGVDTIFHLFTQQGVALGIPWHVQ